MEGIAGTFGPWPFFTIKCHFLYIRRPSAQVPLILICIPPASVPIQSKQRLSLSRPSEYLGRFRGNPSLMKQEVSQMERCKSLLYIPAENLTFFIPQASGKRSRSGMSQFPNNLQPSQGYFSMQRSCHPQITAFWSPEGRMGFPIQPITPLTVAGPPLVVFCPGDIPQVIDQMFENSFLKFSITAEDRPGTLLAPVIIVVLLRNAWV